MIWRMRSRPLSRGARKLSLWCTRDCFKFSGHGVAKLAIEARLPTMHSSSNLVRAGGLMSYSGNRRERYRGVAAYVDKILKGARPGDMPVQQPRKFDFVINLKTAKAIGLTFPPEVLLRATRVIK